MAHTNQRWCCSSCRCTLPLKAAVLANVIFLIFFVFFFPSKKNYVYVPTNALGLSLGEYKSIPKAIPSFQNRMTLGNILDEENFKVGVELGVKKGFFMSEILKRWRSCREYSLVDLWPGEDEFYDRESDLDSNINVNNVSCDGQDVKPKKEQKNKNYVETLARTDIFKRRVEFKICKNETVVCSERYEDEYFDFIYLDARRDRKGVTEDLEAWWPKLKRGGIMAGHHYVIQADLGEDEDWTLNYDGTVDETGLLVKGAVDDFFEKQRGIQIQISYHETNTWNTWAIRKPKDEKYNLDGNVTSKPIATFRTREELGDIVNTEHFSLGIELGVEKGKFMESILTKWTNCKEYSLVDLWQQPKSYKELSYTHVGNKTHAKNYKATLKKMKPFVNRGVEIKVCKDYTTICVKNYPDEYFDFIYVDARHGRKGVSQDLEDWWPKLKRGGIMAGDNYVTQADIGTSPDWTLNFDGTIDGTGLIVKGAVDDFFVHERGLQLQISYREKSPSRSTWAVRKPQTAFEKKNRMNVFVTTCADILQARSTMALIRSIYGTTTTPTHIYVSHDNSDIIQKHLIAPLQNLVKSQFFDLSLFIVSFHVISVPKDFNSQKEQLCSLSRVFLDNEHPNIDYGIYIDNSYLVRKDLKNMYNYLQSFTETTIAAMVWESESATKTNMYTSGNYEGSFYQPNGLNSDVMLIDFGKWRKFGLSQYIRSYHGHPHVLDQEIFNVYFQGHQNQVLRLPCTWNVRMNTGCDKELFQSSIVRGDGYKWGNLDKDMATYLGVSKK